MAIKKQHEQQNQENQQSSREQPQQSRLNKLLGLIDFKNVVTWLVIVVIGGVGWGSKWLYNDYQDRTERRTKVSQEIQHRIPIAQPHAIRDVKLAKKYLDGVDPSYCFHEEYEGVSLRKLLMDWESASGAEVGQEIDQLASNPSPTPEQLHRLLALLNKAFPDSNAEPGPPNGESGRPNPDARPIEADDLKIGRPATGDRDKPSVDSE